MVPEKYVLIKKIKREKHIARLSEKKIQLFVIIGILVSILFGSLFFVEAFHYQEVSENLPAIEKIEILLDGPDAIVNRPSEILDQNQQIILRFENPASYSDYLVLSEIPQEIIDIFKTIENDFFFPQYNGIQKEYLFSFYLCDSFLRENEDEITQEKMTLLAKQVQEKYSKEKVFEWYLNHADFGNHAYGIQTAAQFYFSKNIEELSVAEIALLAGISTTPDHNPVASPVLAGERQQAVLGYMILAGLIKETDVTAINLTPIEITTSEYAPEKYLNGYLRLVMSQIDNLMDLNRFMRGGYQVISTLDLGLQNQIECSADIHFSNLSQTKRVSVEGCDAAQFIPSLRDSEKMIGTSFESKILVIDTEKGNLLAYFDSEPLQKPSSGVILDPFVYLTGFSRGYTPSSMLLDVPSSFGLVNNSMMSDIGDGSDDDQNQLRNLLLSRYDYHGVVSARESLRNGYSAARNDLIEKIGIENLLVNFKLLGILESSFVDETLLLENSLPVDFIDASFAYSLFSTKGSLIGYEKKNDSDNNHIPQIKPNTILILKDFSGNVLFDFTPQRLAISGVENVFLVNDVLTHFQFDERQEINSRAFELVLPIGMQVSENVAQTEQWAVGYSPKRLTAVWTKANNDSVSEVEEQNKISPEASSYLLNGIVKYVHQNLSLADWETPLRIVHQNVCYPSGNLPTSDCMDVREEVFIQGDAPQQYDNLYQKISVNQQTGKLATIFTPQDYIEEKVYLVLPDEAKQWGYENDVVQPPSEYDFLFDIESSTQAPFIQYPENFSYVNNKIEVIGDVAIENFDSYRVSIGKGLFPTEWELIGENDTLPTNDEPLAIFDAEGLNGLYILRLQVIDTEQILSSAYAQITIDTIKPDLSLINPKNKTITDSKLNIQANVEDEIGVESVKFYIDDDLLADFSSGPYALIWELDEGDYELNIVASDLADNETSVSYPIEIR